MYDYISDIDNNDKFKYLAMILACIFDEKVSSRFSCSSWDFIWNNFSLLSEQRSVSIGSDHSSSQQKLRNPIFREAKNLHQDSELLDFLIVFGNTDIIILLYIENLY